MNLKGWLEGLVFRSDSERFFKLHERYAKRPSKPVRWYCVMRCYFLQRRNAASISMSAGFAARPNLPHGIAGVFISKSAVIGRNCTILQQVTIGSNETPGSKKRGAPLIGDNCYIGAGAKIIGGVRIGNNVKIGANCIVVEDIPDHATVVMDKPRVLVREATAASLEKSVAV